MRTGGARDTGRPRARTEVPVTLMDITSGRAANSPQIAVDPAEPRFAVIAHRFDAPDFSCGLRVSGDGGQTWSGADPVPELPEGVAKCYGPEVAFDSEGRLYYLFVGLAGAGNEPAGVYIATSTDAARTFSRPRKVLGPLNFAVRMAIDQQRDRMHLVWLHATSDPGLGAFGPPPNPIMAAYSDDGGRTFSDPVQVSDAARQRVVAPGLALGDDGAVHVAYYDLNDDARDYHNLEGPVWEGTWTVVLASSPDGGRRFTRGVVVDDAIRPPSRPMLIFTMPPPALAVTPDRLCAAWTDARHGDPDILARCSAAPSRRWGKTFRLNDDPVANGKSQYLPRLAASPDGRIDAVFYDRRDDPDDIGTDVYYAYSPPGGGGFAKNMRLTLYPSSPRVGPQYEGPSAEGQFEIGSRLGLLSLKDRALAAWADTRSSRSLTTSQDILATEVVFPSKGPGWQLWAGAALFGPAMALGGWALTKKRVTSRPAPDGES